MTNGYNGSNEFGWCEMLIVLLISTQNFALKSKKNIFILQLIQNIELKLSKLSWNLTKNVKQYMRSPPDEPHLAWRVVIFYSDFRQLSLAYFLCYWAEILICWCQSLGK